MDTIITTCGTCLGEGRIPYFTPPDELDWDECPDCEGTGTIPPTPRPPTPPPPEWVGPIFDDLPF